MMNTVTKTIAAILGTSLLAQSAPASSPTWSKDAIAKVASSRTTPRSAQLRKSKGIVEMEVTVDGRGMITGYRMIKSSGVPILDREADMILFRVGSFNAPPGGAPTRLVIPIRW
jgi:TonB family protein